MNSILSLRTTAIALISLVIGGGAIFAYEQYFGLGRQLALLQAQLATAQTDLTDSSNQSAKEKQSLQEETTSLEGEVEHLTSTVKKLEGQLAEEKRKYQAHQIADNPIVKMMMGMAKARSEAKLKLLTSRLNLSPDQTAAVKAALDAEAAQATQLLGKMLGGGKMDAQSLAVLGRGQSLDQTLKGILTPDQETAYQQVQTEEKATNADTLATAQTNELTNSLQLSSTQRDQVYNALYNVQMHPPPVPTDTPTPKDPASAMTYYNQSVETALSTILTPDQLQLYHQQAQNQASMVSGLIQTMGLSKKTP